MEKISEMLKTLAIIQETEHKKEHHKKFFDSLSMEDLANLGGYGLALYETSSKIATKRILNENNGRFGK